MTVGDNSNKDNDLTKEQKKEARPPKEVDLRRYKDLGGLTIKKLNWGLWYVEHKALLKNLFITFLITIAALSWLYTLYGFGYYILRGMAEDELMVKNLTNTGVINHDAILKASPRDLMFDMPRALKIDEKKYDLFVQAQNPSQNHGAEFEYYFLVNGEETSRQQGFILPAETKYLLSLSQELNFNPVNIQFRIEKVAWQRVDKHEIPDWTKYRDEHLDIVISEAKFTPAKLSGLSERINLNQVEFSASNRTPYNYWSVDFIVALFGGANIVGVNKYSLNEFMSSEEEKITLTWPGNISYVSKVEIIPEINILKDDIYIKYEGRGEEK